MKNSLLWISGALTDICPAGPLRSANCSREVCWPKDFQPPTEAAGPKTTGLSKKPESPMEEDPATAPTAAPKENNPVAPVSRASPRRSHRNHQLSLVLAGKQTLQDVSCSSDNTSGGVHFRDPDWQ